MKFDIHNVDVIFSDKQLQKEFPELQPLYGQWLLGIKVPALRFLAQKSRLELLEKLDTADNRAILEKHFKENVTVQPIDYHTIKNYKIKLDEAEEILNGLSGSVSGFSVSRNRANLYMTTWK